MSKKILQSLVENFDKTASLLEQFVDVCPENLWVSCHAGFPVWQHVYHAWAAVDFFIASVEFQASQSLYPPDVYMFKNLEAAPPSKAQIREVSTLMTKAARRYFASLDDAALAEKNEGLSGRVKAEMTNARTIALLTGHLFYHLGNVDAMLRGNGLQGVF